MGNTCCNPTSTTQLNFTAMMRVSLLIVLLGCVQCLSTEPDKMGVSTEPDTLAINNQESSETQGQNLDFNRMSLLLYRKGRTVVDCTLCLSDPWDDDCRRECSKASLKSNLLFTLLVVCANLKFKS